MYLFIQMLYLCGIDFNLNVSYRVSRILWRLLKYLKDIRQINTIYYQGNFQRKHYFGNTRQPH